MIKCKDCNLRLLEICKAVKKGDNRYWLTGSERAEQDDYSQEGG